IRAKKGGSLSPTKKTDEEAGGVSRIPVRLQVTVAGGKGEPQPVPTGQPTRSGFFRRTTPRSKMTYTSTGNPPSRIGKRRCLGGLLCRSPVCAHRSWPHPEVVKSASDRAEGARCQGTRRLPRGTGGFQVHPERWLRVGYWHSRVEKVPMTQVMVYPQCKGSFDPAQPCPRCAPAPLFTTAHRDASAGWRQEASVEKRNERQGGRVTLETLLALGLCYGFVQMGMASPRALGSDATSAARSPLVGLILFQSIQALALLGGGALAGAGQT